ncbi:MAG TPA: hypothetical protein VF432_01035 [Thermoanaerobaculia bacterium]
MNNEHHFDAEITLSGRAEGAVWSSAAEALGERVYDGVRVRAAWSVPGDAPVIRVPLHVIDERANGDARDLPAFVELFFHDAFLLFNIAAPGSFGGVVSVSGGDYRVNELAFDESVFAYASASLAALPLRDVVAWYDSLQNGTRQLATTGVTKALFHLLHLGRGSEDDDRMVLRLAQSAEALAVPAEDLTPLFALRDAVARGTAPVIHPMFDDALDPSVDDPSCDWSAVIDDAAGRVIGALQALAASTPASTPPAPPRT